MLQQTEKAQAKYEAAAKASPKNSRVLRQVAAFYLRAKKNGEAEPLLHQIIALETPETITDSCWARRNLAIVLQSHGDFEHFLQGMALIEENLRSKASSLEDKHARVHSWSPIPAGRSSARRSRPWRRWSRTPTPRPTTTSLWPSST